MKHALETRAEATADLRKSDRAIPHWFNLAAAVSGFIGVLVGLAAFWSAQSIGLARLQQDAVASANMRSAEQDRLRLEYVRVAIALLTPAKPTEAQKELRGWAVELLDKSAEVKLSAEQKQNLINGTSAFPYGTDYGYGNGYGTTTVTLMLRA
jgi:hypothetical protein